MRVADSKGHSVSAMFSGEVELEPSRRTSYEATRWQAARAAFLSQKPAAADHVLDRTRRRIILLTVFEKTKRQERRQIERARRAMERCIDEGHTAEDDDGRTNELERHQEAEV